MFKVEFELEIISYLSDRKFALPTNVGPVNNMNMSPKHQVTGRNSFHDLAKTVDIKIPIKQLLPAKYFNSKTRQSVTLRSMGITYLVPYIFDASRICLVPSQFV